MELTEKELQDKTDQANKAGIEAERARVQAIRGIQADADPKVIEELIGMGATVEEATKVLKLRRLNALTESAPQTSGGGVEPHIPSQEKEPDFSQMSVKDKGEYVWAHDAGMMRLIRFGARHGGGRFK